MDINNIILKIKEKLIGDKNQDIITVLRILQQNRIEPGSKEFDQICNELFTTNSLENILIEQDEETLRDDIIDVLSDIISFKDIGKEDEAFSLIEPLISAIEERELDTTSLDSNEKVFYQPMEHLIYTQLEDESKDYNDLKYPLDQVYFLYGLLLSDKGDYKKAAQALQKALKFTPMSEAIRLELAEVYKCDKEFDKALEESIYVLVNGFTPEHLGHAFRNISYVFLKKGLYQEATIALELAKGFEKDISKINNDLESIREKAGEIPSLPAPQVAQEMLAKYNVPLVGSLFPAQLALDMAHISEKEGQYDVALYYYDIYNKIEPREELNKKIRELTEKLLETYS